MKTLSKECLTRIWVLQREIRDRMNELEKILNDEGELDKQAQLILTTKIRDLLETFPKRRWDPRKRVIKVICDLAELETVSELVAKTEVQLLRYRGLGPIGVDYIKDCLAKHGLTLKG